MIDTAIDILKDSLIDSIRLLPFLIVTYLIMEAIERAAGGKTAKMVKKAGPFGPALGAILGVFPQCGFSAAASNFYSGGLIKLGTLIAVFLSTSDEMLPVFIAEQVGLGTILKVLLAKVIIGLITGYLIFFLADRIFQKQKTEMQEHRKKHGHDCSEEERSLVVEALIRSLKTFAFILVITIVLDGIIHVMGEDFLSSILKDAPIIGQLIAGAVGLIPNCAASIIISQLYVTGVIGSGTMMTGLLAGAGVGLLVLFEENRNLKENIMIILLLYVVSVIWGLIIEFSGIVF